MYIDYTRLRQLMADMEEAFPYVGKDTVVCMGLQRLAFEMNEMQKEIEALRETPRP